MDLFQFLEFLIQCALNRIRIRRKEKKDSYPVIWIRVLRPELFILVWTRKPVRIYDVASLLYRTHCVFRAEPCFI